MPGFLALLTAKLAGLGALAKAAVAAVTAAVTMTLAGGATGVIPLPGSRASSAPVAAEAIRDAAAAVSTARSAVPAATLDGTGAQAGAGTSRSTTPSTAAGSAARTTASAAAGTATSVAGASKLAGAATSAAASAGNLPTVAVANSPALPALPSCVTNLSATGGTVPDPAKVLTQLPTCIRTVIGARLPLDVIQSAIASAHLPVDVTKCLTSVIRAVPGLAAGDMSALAQLVSSCTPGSIPGMRSVPGVGSIPGLGSFPAGGRGR